MQIDKYQLQEIGSGNFSTVYKAINTQTLEIIAIKIMNSHRSIARKQANLLKKLKHPNIIKFIKYNQNESDRYQLLMQYLPTNVLTLYQQQIYGLKEQQVKCILFQVALGLAYIHKQGIIHRDIKPQNILINKQQAIIKLIDFGLAISELSTKTDYIATRWYRAPQNLLMTKQYTTAIDIFSLGCVIVQLYLGNPLFPGSNNLDQIYKIFNILGQPTKNNWQKGYIKLKQMGLKINNNSKIKNYNNSITLKQILTPCNQKFIKLITKMLQLNPKNRITAQQIIKDQYFNDINLIIPQYVYSRFLQDYQEKPKNSVLNSSILFFKENYHKDHLKISLKEVKNSNINVHNNNNNNNNNANKNTNKINNSYINKDNRPHQPIPCQRRQLSLQKNYKNISINSLENLATDSTYRSTQNNLNNKYGSTYYYFNNKKLENSIKLSQRPNQYQSQLKNIKKNHLHTTTDSPTYSPNHRQNWFQSTSKLHSKYKSPQKQSQIQYKMKVNSQQYPQQKIQKNLSSIYMNNIKKSTTIQYPKNNISPTLLSPKNIQFSNITMVKSVQLIDSPNYLQQSIKKSSINNNINNNHNISNQNLTIRNNNEIKANIINSNLTNSPNYQRLSLLQQSSPISINHQIKNYQIDNQINKNYYHYQDKKIQNPYYINNNDKNIKQIQQPQQQLNYINYRNIPGNYYHQYNYSHLASPRYSNKVKQFNSFQKDGYNYSTEIKEFTNNNYPKKVILSSFVQSPQRQRYSIINGQQHQR